MAQLLEVKVPDIGDFADVPVIEIAVRPGDRVAAEATLLTLESDKATMDVPAPSGGIVREVKVVVGDKVSQGSVVVMLEAVGAESVDGAKDAGVAQQPSLPPTSSAEMNERGSHLSPPMNGRGAGGEGKPLSAASSSPLPLKAEPITAPLAVHMPSPEEIVAELDGLKPHASPSIRRFARELGVDVTKVTGSGPKGRITQQDVQAYVKSVMSGSAASATAPVAPGASGGGGLDLLPWPKVDFAKFGPVESKPLSRIKKLSGANLARNWAMIPHVTQFDEADIGDLEAFRVALNKEHEKEGPSTELRTGVKLTMLAFLIKASVAALKQFPEFNASLDGENLVLKQYYHIGFAADTPNGLVVPVLRDADKKGLLDIAREMAELLKKARDGKLTSAEMQGGCFTISSLGGIGGTAFTPIINAPEVAILGVSKGETKPKWDEVCSQFVPRLMLPLSLSYDHRVIDGAAAARFTTFLTRLLGDLRRVLL